MRKLLIVLSLVCGIAGCAGTGTTSSYEQSSYGWDRGSLGGSGND